MLETAFWDAGTAGDILRAHRALMFISTLTTGMALGVGSLAGAQGIDALMAGVLDLPSLPGIVSLGWWSAVALVPYKLREILSRTRKTTPAAAGATVPASAVAPPPTGATAVLQRRASHPPSPHTDRASGRSSPAWGFRCRTGEGGGGESEDGFDDGLAGR
ncbi:hypothetical protein AOB60_02285 [Streptomyces noursei]|uniref:Uncharacterized protein n=1 Tax=Streptomyces noursei TaxID=1971 RepID=A0A2N8PFY1_STRNR|nr:hypothetical protein AOB60_02285 [Streptomyces noursei]